MRFTHTSHGTGSDDGLWTCIVDDATVAIIEFAYWEDLDSSAIPTYGKYNVQAGYVHVPYANAALVPNLVASLRCCGWQLARDAGPRWAENDPLDIVDPYSGTVVCAYGRKGKARRHWLLCVSECMWKYGANDIACDVSGNNRAKLFRKARGAL